MKLNILVLVITSFVFFATTSSAAQLEGISLELNNLPEVVTINEEFDVELSVTNDSAITWDITNCGINSSSDTLPSFEVPMFDIVDAQVKLYDVSNMLAVERDITTTSSFYNKFTNVVQFIDKSTPPKTIPIEVPVGGTVTYKFTLKPYSRLNEVNIGEGIDTNVKFGCVLGVNNVVYENDTDHNLRIDNILFPDIVGHTFQEYINNLALDGIVSGFSSGEFKSDEEVTRGQMAKFIVKAFRFQIDTTGEKFPDVRDMDDELSRYVQTLKNLGIVSGFNDGNYKMNDVVSRGQVTKFVSKAFEAKGIAVDYTLSNSFTDVKPSNDFYIYISYLANIDFDGEKIINGKTSGDYGPNENLTRGAMSKIIDIARNALSSLPEGEAKY